MQEVIRRVSEMEREFDFVLDAWAKSPASFWQDEAVRASMDRLMHYYQGGQWLKDYELDENGGLPKDMKRGILSEDGFWNFLCDVQEQKP